LLKPVLVVIRSPNLSEIIFKTSVLTRFPTGYKFLVQNQDLIDFLTL